jgi:hypothetical protein
LGIAQEKRENMQREAAPSNHVRPSHLLPVMLWLDIEITRKRDWTRKIFLHGNSLR